MSIDIDVIVARKNISCQLVYSPFSLVIFGKRWYVFPFCRIEVRYCSSQVLKMIQLTHISLMNGISEGDQNRNFESLFSSEIFDPWERHPSKWSARYADTTFVCFPTSKGLLRWQVDFCCMRIGSQSSPKTFYFHFLTVFRH